MPYRSMLQPPVLGRFCELRCSTQFFESFVRQLFAHKTAFLLTSNCCAAAIPAARRVMYQHVLYFHVSVAHHEAETYYSSLRPSCAIVCAGGEWSSLLDSSITRLPLHVILRSGSLVQANHASGSNSASPDDVLCCVASVALEFRDFFRNVPAA